MTKQDVAYFVSFCIEQYKNKNGLSGEAAMQLLDSYGVLQYLSDHAEILHTQSRQWLMEEIEEYIRLPKGEPK
ncbi:MAG: DUF3791 domain-containing protein [Bacteroidales bacterium]|nr:DUF3791 domain-containing protein [Bacteroidales bacterium]